MHLLRRRRCNTICVFPRWSLSTGGSGVRSSANSCRSRPTSSSASLTVISSLGESRETRRSLRKRDIAVHGHTFCSYRPTGCSGCLRTSFRLASRKTLSLAVPIAQMAGRRLLIADVIGCGICRGQSGSGARYLPSISFLA